MKSIPEIMRRARIVNADVDIQGITILILVVSIIIDENVGEVVCQPSLDRWLSPETNDLLLLIQMKIVSPSWILWLFLL